MRTSGSFPACRNNSLRSKYLNFSAVFVPRQVYQRALQLNLSLSMYCRVIESMQRSVGQAKIIIVPLCNHWYCFFKCVSFSYLRFLQTYECQRGPSLKNLNIRLAAFWMRSSRRTLPLLFEYPIGIILDACIKTTDASAQTGWLVLTFTDQYHSCSIHSWFNVFRHGSYAPFTKPSIFRSFSNLRTRLCKAFSNLHANSWSRSSPRSSWCIQILTIRKLPRIDHLPNHPSNHKTFFYRCFLPLSIELC